MLTVSAAGDVHRLSLSVGLFISLLIVCIAEQLKGNKTSTIRADNWPVFAAYCFIFVCSSINQSINHSALVAELRYLKVKQLVHIVRDMPDHCRKSSVTMLMSYLTSSSLNDVTHKDGHLTKAFQMEKNVTLQSNCRKKKLIETGVVVD